MVRIILLILAIAVLSGCATDRIKLRTETVEVYKPILYCPAPDWNGLDKPFPLAIDDITDDMSDGEVVKRYKATVKQLLDYTDRLERRLEKYDDTNEAYDELKKQFLEQKKNDGFVIENPPSE